MTQKFPGSHCKLSLLRDGVHIEVDALLKPIPELIPATAAAPALYVCWGGLVFVPLSLPYLIEAFGDEMEEAPQSLIGAVARAKRSFAVTYIAPCSYSRINIGSTTCCFGLCSC